MSSRLSFRSRLTRDAAYSAVLGKNRRLLHSLAAQCLRKQLVPGAADELELLAELVRHHRAAGEWQEATERQSQRLLRLHLNGLRSGWDGQVAIALDCWAQARQQSPGLPELSTWLLLALGHAAVRDGRHEAGKAQLSRGLEQAAQEQDGLLTGMLLNAFGGQARERGELAAAEEYFASAVRELRRVGAESELASALNNLGTVLRSRGKPQEARERLEEALVLARARCDLRGSGVAQGSLGILNLSEERYAEAQECFSEELEAARATGDLRGECWALYHFGVVCMLQGETAQSRVFYEQNLAMLRELNDRLGVAHACESLGYLTLEIGDLDAAERYLSEALSLCREYGDQRGSGRSLDLLAHVVWRRDGRAAAFPLFAESRQLLLSSGDIPLLQSLLEGWLKLELSAGDNQDAVLVNSLSAELQELSVFEESQGVD